MLKDITIGQYIPGSSPVHKLDPRAKILMLIIYMIALFMCDSALGYIEITVFTLLIIFMSGIPIIILLKGLRPLWIILLITFSLHIFMTPGEILWQWKFLTITYQGLRQAIFMVLRLIYLVTITSLLTLTTTPIALTDGIERLLKAAFVPVAHELAMMMTIALRFIPTLLNETDRIMKAQLARGAELDQGGIIKRLRAFIPVLVPLFVIVFKRADELAVAMEARGYRGGVGRSRMHPLCWSLSDTLALIFVAIATLVFIYVDRWA